MNRQQIREADEQIRAEFQRQLGRRVHGDTYIVTDNRRIAQEEPMSPAVNQARTGDLAVPATADTPEIRFHLEPIQLQWNEYVMWHGQEAEANRFMKRFKELLPGVVGDANALYLGNHEVATYRRDAKLNLTQLAKEHPEIITRYTRMMAEERFDEAAFRAEMPDMHAAYRGRSLRLVN